MYVRGCLGEKCELEMLVDSGASCNYISKRLV
jgi:hypothetical protein